MSSMNSNYSAALNGPGKRIMRALLAGDINRADFSNSEKAVAILTRYANGNTFVLANKIKIAALLRALVAKNTEDIVAVGSVPDIIIFAVCIAIAFMVTINPDRVGPAAEFIYSFVQRNRAEIARIISGGLATIAGIQAIIEGINKIKREGRADMSDDSGSEAYEAYATSDDEVSSGPGSYSMTFAFSKRGGADLGNSDILIQKSCASDPTGSPVAWCVIKNNDIGEHVKITWTENFGVFSISSTIEAGKRIEIGSESGSTTAGSKTAGHMVIFGEDGTHPTFGDFKPCDKTGINVHFNKTLTQSKYNIGIRNIDVEVDGTPGGELSGVMMVKSVDAGLDTRFIPETRLIVSRTQADVYNGSVLAITSDPDPKEFILTPGAGHILIRYASNEFYEDATLSTNAAVEARIAIA